METQVRGVETIKRPGKGHRRLHRLYIEQQGHCFYCDCLMDLPPPFVNQRPMRTTVTCDYLIPRSRGGTGQAHNLVGACYACNSAKGNKPWPQFLQLTSHLETSLG